MCTLLRHSVAERDEFDITLALLDDEPAAYAPPDWVKVKQFDCRGSLLRSVLAVRKLRDEVKPDVTVSFLTRANLANIVNASVPCIVSERANTAAHLGGGVRGATSRALVRAFYPNATRVVAVSEGVAQELLENYSVPGDRLITIANPVDVDAIQAKARESSELEIEGPYIVAAGRLQKSKNFDMLIRAYAALDADRKLVIMGEGAERANLMNTIAECGVTDRVLLPGFVSNPFAVMRGADMFVLSSNSEGFPNAMVEAMAIGVPVIATNCASGPSEILAEVARDQITKLTFAEHGVIVPPNSPALMAEALRAMCDPERRQAYGKKATARVRAFGPDVAKDRYWDVVRTAMREGSSRVAHQSR